MQTQTPFVTRGISLIITHINFPQVMDCQLNSELLGRILEEDIISPTGGESDDRVSAMQSRRRSTKTSPTHTTIFNHWWTNIWSTNSPQQIPAIPILHKYQHIHHYTWRSPFIINHNHHCNILHYQYCYFQVVFYNKSSKHTTKHTSNPCPNHHRDKKKSPTGHILKTRRSCTNIITSPTSMIPPAHPQKLLLH